MSENRNIVVYLRKTNGTGEKIVINPLITNYLLYVNVAQILHMPEKSFKLYLKGRLINQSNFQSLISLQIQSDSIIHIKQKFISSQDKIQLRVFCQGSVYSYQAFKNSTIQSLKVQISNRLGCNFNHIVISHLGRAFEDNQTLVENQIKDNDILSVFICPFIFGKIGSVRLKPKMAQSLTFAPSDELDVNYQPFSRQIMRKSSMKSSHQSRQLNILQTKKLFNDLRPKSQSQLPWLSSQRMIETQSINFDDPDEQQDPQFWKDCKIQLQNEANTMFYTIQCSQNHNLDSVLKLLSKCQKKQTNQISIVFPNENMQKMAQQGQSLIEIAKKNKIRIIHNVIFK